MMRTVTFAIAAIVFVCGVLAAATQPPVTVVSPCECRDNHGKGRWAVKNDPSTPPAPFRVFALVLVEASFAGLN
jgi:hypothetical protein